jgi:hypothetical protein
MLSLSVIEQHGPSRLSDRRSSARRSASWLRANRPWSICRPAGRRSPDAWSLLRPHLSVVANAGAFSVATNSAGRFLPRGPHGGVSIRRGRGLTARNVQERLQERWLGILPGDGMRDRRRVPAPGQQLVEPAGEVIGNAMEHVGEPSLRGVKLTVYSTARPAHLMNPANCARLKQKCAVMAATSAFVQPVRRNPVHCRRPG